MITGFFLGIGVSILQFFVDLLPVIAFPSNWLTSISLFWGIANTMNFLVPLSTLVTILGYALALEVGLFAINSGTHIYKLIRGI